MTQKTKTLEELTPKEREELEQLDAEINFLRKRLGLK